MGRAVTKTESDGAKRPGSLRCIQFSQGSELLGEWRWPAAFRLDSRRAFYYKHAFRWWVSREEFCAAKSAAQQ